MKTNVLAAFRFLTSKTGLVAVFVLFCGLFQIYVLTRFKVFYPVLRVLFYLLVVQLLAAFIRAARKQPLLWPAVLLIVLVRVPFYIHANGAMVTSDNALDGLQSVEMRATHRAPFFLLGAVKHMGTIKHLAAAFLMDVMGNRYLAYLLIQTLLFIVVLFTLFDLLRDSLHPPALFVFVFLTQFAFIETIFDYSLSLRGAPYLEMLFFILLGAGLIDREFRAKGRTFLGYYFVFFSIYIHPLGAVLAGCFGLVALIYSAVRRRVGFHAAAAAAGLAAGLYHWIYYLLFLPKPVASGGWEEMGILPFSQISWGYIGAYARVLKETFAGLFNFEFSFLATVYDTRQGAAIAAGINRGLIWISLAVLAAAVALSVRKIFRLVRRREALRDADWPLLLTVVLAAAFAVKAFLFYPPHVEPRHNFDLVLLIILSYGIIFSGLFRRGRIRSWKTAVILGFAVLATIPHYGTFYRVVLDKEDSYREILQVLRQARLHYLSTDFIVAYPIYFLSGGTIRVSDTLGPYRVRDFYPDMRAVVDAVPADEKAYLFFSEAANDRPLHKISTRLVLRRTQNALKTDNIAYHIHRLRDFDILIPRRRSSAP